MRKMVEDIKTHYKAGTMPLSAIKAMLKAKKITQEEYDYIIAPDDAEDEQ